MNEITPEQQRLIAIGERVERCSIKWSTELGCQIVLTPELSWCKNAKGLLLYLKS